jgi:hypothetical protein
VLNQWKSKRDAEVAKIDADYLEKVSNMTAGRDQYKEWYSQAEELDKERRAKFHKMVSPDRIFVHDESRGQQAIVLGPSRVCKGCRSRNLRVGSVQVRSRNPRTRNPWVRGSQSSEPTRCWSFIFRGCAGIRSSVFGVLGVSEGTDSSAVRALNRDGYRGMNWECASRNRGDVRQRHPWHPLTRAVRLAESSKNMAFGDYTI